MTNEFEQSLETAQPDLCPWCNKDTCEWFIGLPCQSSGHLAHFHTPEQKESFDKRGYIADYKQDDDEDDDNFQDECDHCNCYWDAYDDDLDGECCDCGKRN